MFIRNFWRNILRRRNCVDDTRACNVARNSSKDESDSNKENPKPFEEMPKVPMIPLFGSAWAYFPIIGRYSIARMHQADLHKNKVYGDIVRERFGDFELVSSYRPETLKCIVDSEVSGYYPSKAKFSTLKAYRRRKRGKFPTDGIFALEGDDWKDLRLDIFPYFKNDEFNECRTAPLHDIAMDFVDLILFKRDTECEVHDALAYLSRWALECVGYAALDIRLGCLSPKLEHDSDVMKMINSIQTQMACINKLEPSCGNFPFWKYFRTHTWKEFEEATDVFTGLAYKYIERAVNQALAKPFKKGDCPSLLQYLLLEKKMERSIAEIMVLDVLMAGIDTTSIAAGFLLYNLAKHPEKQDHAYKEVIRLLPRKQDKMTLEIFNQMEYLKNCFKESMRLYPAVRGVLRILKRDVVLHGYKIPAGTAVICVLQVIQKNEEYYPSPHEFLPDRWIEEKDQHISKYSYNGLFHPFGYGIRSCVGRRLVELELTSITAVILRRFKVEYHYGDIGMYTKLVNAPDKFLRFRFRDRPCTFSKSA